MGEYLTAIGWLEEKNGSDRERNKQVTMFSPDRSTLPQNCKTGRVAVLIMFLVGLFCSLPTSNAVIAGEILSSDEIVKGLVPITGESELKKRSVDLSIEFKVNSSTLTEDAKRQLESLATALKSLQLSKARFSINGHTDASGSAKANQLLSQRRAKAVADYLVEAKNIPANRLDIIGLGETRLKNPLIPNSKENRRVEVINLNPELSGGKIEIKRKSGYEAIN